ncbi:MAG TPA: Maf family protein [Candidatus Baltobacteraceae bacterium]|jgi:septum formation protein|nr:Maf family protein [Candidatus Baltobacteraceae bacterium]
MAIHIDNLVLASSSPRRLELLRSLNLQVEVIPSRYDEPERPDLLARELAIVHARHKCEDVRSRIADRLVVAADTVVEVDRQAYNKPRSVAEAKTMLHLLSGRTHVVHTAFAIALPEQRELVETCESTFVTFFALTQHEIDDYVASGEPMDKAGAYGIQGYGATLVERVDGDFYTVMGFPVARFVRTMRELGFELPITNKGSTLT